MGRLPQSVLTGVVPPCHGGHRKTFSSESSSVVVAC